MAGVIDYSTTESSNSTIGAGSLDIAENCAAANMNDAIRLMMKDIADGMTDGNLSGVGYITKSGAYTALEADRGKVMDGTAAMTLTLTAAATLGAGWCIFVKANGGAVTIDPNASETIDGSATKVVADGTVAFIRCDGSNFTTALETGAGTDPQVTTIELGHATDTTLARVSAGVMSVEGVNVVTVSSTDTLTNKTFNANGTGNSLSNVDVADLANGTDGELITWDASGAPATVGVGTAGQVLTSKGAGAAPTFTNVAAGMWARAGYSGGTPTDDASYNVTSITDTGTGDMTHNLTTALSSSSLPVLSTNMFTSGSEAHQYGVMSSTSAVRSITYESVTAQDWRRSAVVIGA